MLGKHCKMIDSHYHIRGCNDGHLEPLLAVPAEIRRILGLETVCVAAVPAWDVESIGQNVLCAAFKALYPDSYAYAGLDHYLSGASRSGEDYLQQVQLFERMGFDGIKCIEGKPTSRRALGVGFDDARYADCLAYLEKQNTPILWHVADPEENWHRASCTPHVINAGWCYDDPSFISKETLYRETETVLDRYPALNVSFAHLYFLSNDLPRLSHFLDKYATVYVDVTPGCEMYYSFGRERDRWREFFMQHADRIVLGTDNGWGEDESAAQKVVDGCKKVLLLDAFFSTDDPVQLWNGSIVRGLNLPATVLQQLYYENFMRRHHHVRPCRFDVALAAQYAAGVWENMPDIPEPKKSQLKHALDLLQSMANNAGT